MSLSALESLKIKAKLLQKAKKKAGRPILLKEALASVAKAAGFASWRELKEVYEATEHFSPRNWSAHWKIWYASYEDALRHLEGAGGYLLPYQKQFFICDIHYIERLGIAADSPDLEKIGPNWVEPRDLEAWARVLKKIKSRRP